MKTLKKQGKYATDFNIFLLRYIQNHSSARRL